MGKTDGEDKLQFSRTDYIDAVGAQIACHRYGFGRPVICLHATGHGARDFVKLAHSLGDKYEFIAIDWPGQGDSPPDELPVTASQYAQVLEVVLAVLDLKNVVLLGNSIGGAAAILYAANKPQNISALVLCNPSGLQPVNLIARMYCQHMARFFAKGARGDVRFAAAFTRYYEKTILPKPDAAWRREEIIADGYKNAPLLQKAWTGFANSDADIRHLTPKLTMPVYYAWAKGDKAVAWSRSKKAALQAPKCETSFFDGGHSAFLECPKQFADCFENFMAGEQR